MTTSSAHAGSASALASLAASTLPLTVRWAHAVALESCLSELRDAPTHHRIHTSLALPCLFVLSHPHCLHFPPSLSTFVGNRLLLSLNRTQFAHRFPDPPEQFTWLPKPESLPEQTQDALPQRTLTHRPSLHNADHAQSRRHCCLCPQFTKPRHHSLQVAQVQFR